MVNLEEKPVVVISGCGAESTFHPSVGHIVAHDFPIGIRHGHIVEVAAHYHIGVALVNHLAEQCSLLGVLAEGVGQLRENRLAGLLGFRGLILGFQFR